MKTGERRSWVQSRKVAFKRRLVSKDRTDIAMLEHAVVPKPIDTFIPVDFTRAEPGAE